MENEELKNCKADMEMSFRNITNYALLLEREMDLSKMDEFRASTVLSLLTAIYDSCSKAVEKCNSEGWTYSWEEDLKALV